MRQPEQLTRLIRQKAPERLTSVVSDEAQDSVTKPTPSPSTANATPAMTDDAILPFSFRSPEKSTRSPTTSARDAPIEKMAVLRGYTETRHKAKSWDRERRTIARIEATMLGLDIRFVVTSLDAGSAEWIYDSLYCARGQAENLIKLHKTQLFSDRTSCRSALANQVRLVLHTAAYWLMLTVRDAIPKVRELATAEFATLRLRLDRTYASAIPIDQTVLRSAGGALSQGGGNERFSHEALRQAFFSGRFRLEGPPC
jgi:hypothetical protein